MSRKLSSTFFPYLIAISLLFVYLYSQSLSSPPTNPPPISPRCNLLRGKWVLSTDPPPPLYNESCPFHRNAWNCLRNRRDNMGTINSYRWVPKDCILERVDPFGFLDSMRNRNIGFVGDSLNENFLVAFLCALRVADGGARSWKKKGAWRGGYFPKYNVTVAYHRAVLLAKYEVDHRYSTWRLLCYESNVCNRVNLGGALKRSRIIKFVAYHHAALLAKDCGRVCCFENYVLTASQLINQRWQPEESLLADDTKKGTYHVDVDVPAKEWASISNFYDVLIFNTGHWWNHDKFPTETPLVFYRAGKPMLPPPGLFNGLEIVLDNMVAYIEREFPRKTLKFWRLQSPRHFYGGDWNQNGSCLFEEPLKEHELDLWFDPSNNGVNKEARLINQVIEEKLQGSGIRVLDLTHLSEFRADAHPAIWLGKKDAVAIWGQDCMHWCLPGLPDTWVDILSELVRIGLGTI